MSPLKLISYALTVPNDLKPSNALLRLFWNIAVKYIIKCPRKLDETEWTCQFLVCAKYFNLIGQDFKTMMKRRSYFSWECEEWSGSKHSESFLIYKTVIMYINFKYVQNFVSHIMDERRVRVF
jgi:hypothetical protein